MTRKSRFKASGPNDAWFAGACLIGLIVWGLASRGEAQEAKGPDVAFNVAVGSDYVFRGVSQTEEDPAISAGFDLTSGSFYAGAWASNVSYAGDPDTNAEIDVYGGYRAEISGWAVDVGGVGYIYTNQPNGADYDYVEAKLAVSRAVGSATVGGAIFYSPDFFGASEDEATYVEANAAFSPADKWTVSGALGRQFVSSDFDYTTWNLGVAYQLTDTLVLDGRYYDTDEHAFGAVYDSRVVASIKAVF
ncbi:TorF family putative porin [Brevundimonas sp. PAMC22021]|uniref:TorF family putative porin n=1 Tax=Brevundimonas sp. PAMC22021 TaxID=2861285 RepID=UPI001C6312CC|nr:TorF family putative porin [Brevundimonas sp. PAMC22021]QYF87241.1 TorF family putative porin [Brevundimonas sp. PAMC22021]